MRRKKVKAKEKPNQPNHPADKCLDREDTNTFHRIKADFQNAPRVVDIWIVRETFGSGHLAWYRFRPREIVTTGTFSMRTVTTPTSLPVASVITKTFTRNTSRHEKEDCS